MSARQHWEETSRVRRLFGLPTIPDAHFYVTDPENPGECGNPTCFLPREASCHMAPPSPRTEHATKETT